jgi:hypothetical protein
MRVAIKFDQFLNEELGVELVLAPKQMLLDVYVYERDPFPSLEAFENGWITRPNSQEFWVYRQGTFIDIDRLPGMYVLKAETKQLDAIPMTLENYHHTPKLSFVGGYKWNLVNEMISNRRSHDDLEWLYQSIVQQRVDQY